MMTELLAHGNDRVVRAMSGALRNLAIDARNKDLLGETWRASCSVRQCLKYCLKCLFIKRMASVVYSKCFVLVWSGKHAVPHLVANLPGGGQSQPVRALSEETVVSVLSTLHEVLGSSLDAAKTLRASQGIERLVLINKDG